MAKTTAGNGPNGNATAKPKATAAEVAAKEKERAAAAQAHQAAQALTRVSRREARNAVHIPALKRFWVLVSKAETFRYGDIGIKIGETPSIAKLVADAPLDAGDWRNVGLRCMRHYEKQAAVEHVPDSKPVVSRVVAGASPDTKPVARVRKVTAPRAKAAAKKRAAPSPAAAKAKAAKAKAAKAKAAEALLAAAAEAVVTA